MKGVLAEVDGMNFSQGLLLVRNQYFSNPLPPPLYKEWGSFVAFTGSEGMV